MCAGPSGTRRSTSIRTIVDRRLKAPPDGVAGFDVADPLVICKSASSQSDFGTGYPSLAQLKRFPLRSFIAGVTANAKDAAIARAIILLAHSLGMEVVAEGVETEQQDQFLSKLGHDIAQGPLIGAPLQDAAIAGYMEEQSAFAMI